MNEFFANRAIDNYTDSGAVSQCGVQGNGHGETVSQGDVFGGWFAIGNNGSVQPIILHTDVSVYSYPYRFCFLDSGDNDDNSNGQGQQIE